MQQVSRIVCPSGLTGSVRKLKVSDLDIFSDRVLSKKGGAAMEAELASRVWMETEDRGPYLFDGAAPPWQTDVLQGDRFYTILQARILTRGPEYWFDVQCDNAACRNKFQWEVDLNNLPVVTLPDTSRRALQQGNRFATTLPSDGRVVYWSLPTGKVQRRMDRYIKEHGQSLSVIFAARILGVEGEERVDHLALMRDLDIEDFDCLVGEMQAADCGVETGIEVECPSCGQIMEVDVGFGRDFFARDFSRIRSLERRPGRTS